MRRVPVKKNPKNEPEDHALGRSRGGFGTKIHLVCDSQGIPITALLSAGNRHDTTMFFETMDAARIFQKCGRPRTRPYALAADKGYSSQKNKAWLAQRKIQAVIPTKSNQAPDPKFCKDNYKRRNIVERVFGWLKEARRLATRFEKLAINYLAMVKLAMIKELLKYDLSDRA